MAEATDAAARIAAASNEYPAMAAQDARDRKKQCGRPQSPATHFIFYVLCRIYESFFEAPYAVTVDVANGVPRGHAMEWTMTILRHTTLATWASEHHQGVADQIARARRHSLDLEAAERAVGDVTLYTLLRKRKRGRPKKPAWLKKRRTRIKPFL